MFTILSNGHIGLTFNESTKSFLSVRCKNVLFGRAPIRRWTEERLDVTAMVVQLLACIWFVLVKVVRS